MDIEKRILSDITIHNKYARFIPELNRRETWEEIVQRNRDMHKKTYPKVNGIVDDLYRDFVLPKKVLPSMRSMQFGGKAIEVTPNRMYNCAYTPMDSLYSFSEIMFLLLGGTGVGLSVQKHHVRELPIIRKPSEDRKRRYLISDNIEGWADSIKVLMKTYFGLTTSNPVFDFSDIRPKGSRLVTSGGKAPGAQPLKECLIKIQGVLDNKKDGEKLTTIEVYDIVCHIADAVLAGGIRRAALITLFSADDELMMSAKTGDWMESEPQRGRSNNSVVLLRHKITREFFDYIWERIQVSGMGEPGIFLSNDKDCCVNPCGEISLRAHQFCNLTEINASNVVDQADFESRVVAATILGTLQAGYTDFHYIREDWKRQTERDGLLGVSMTGIASNRVRGLDIKKAVKLAIRANQEWAGIIGINPAARITSVKPSGTTSLVLGTSSGIHAWHDHYYLRRMRIMKNDPLYFYFLEYHKEMLEDDYFRPHDTAIIVVPQSAPMGATLRNEHPLNLLERIKFYAENWIQPGFISGANGHNISATIYVKEDQWKEVGDWMWKNRDCYNGLTVLPYDGGEYKQPPFEECTKEEYNKRLVFLKDVDLRRVEEEEDNTDLKGELACGGNGCEVDTMGRQYDDEPKIEGYVNQD